MKFLHTADLHIGKKLHERSLIEDQEYILNQIYDIAVQEGVTAVVIAGDIYDRSVPATEAVELLDTFLTKLISAGIYVIMISGNHDSPQRVAFADKILEKQGLYIAGDYNGELKSITLEDEEGPVTFVCMPFVKPAVVGCSTLAEAVEQMLSRHPMVMSLNHRYVLVTHYFVVGEHGEEPELSDSETDLNVGGLDCVPASLFSTFSYVALGHIHKPQRVGGRNIYYSGSPLKYSFGEAKSDKTVNIVELTGREVKVEKVILKPLHEMRCIKGRLEELICKEVVELNAEDREDYLQVTLTDTEELIDPIGTLRSVYPNVLQLLMEKNYVTDKDGYVSKINSVKKNIPELFAEFYEMLKGENPDEKRMQIVEEIAQEVGNS